MIKISLFSDARYCAYELLNGLSCCMLKLNDPLSNEEKIKIADYHLLYTKLKEVVAELEGIIFHCEHGLNGTIPEDWNAFGDEEEEGHPYSPHDAILELCHSLEKLPLFPLSILEFIRQAPDVERKFDEFFDEKHGDSLVTVKDDGSTEKQSKRERIQQIQDKYLNRVENTFGVERWPYDILEIKKLAVTKQDLNKILEIIVQ